MARPMVKREESFELDIAAELTRRSKPVFLMIAAVAIWGYLWFVLTGQFFESAMFVIFSFIVFQAVRPSCPSIGAEP